MTFMHVTKFKSVFQIRFLYISILAITVAVGYPKYKNINGNKTFMQEDSTVKVFILMD